MSSTQVNVVGEVIKVVLGSPTTIVHQGRERDVEIVGSQSELDALPKDGSRIAKVQPHFGDWSNGEYLQWKNGAWAHFADPVPDKSVDWEKLADALRFAIERFTNNPNVQELSWSNATRTLTVTRMDRAGNVTNDNPIVIPGGAAAATDWGDIPNQPNWTKDGSVVLLATTDFTAADDGSFPGWDSTDEMWENFSFKSANGITFTVDLSDHTWSASIDADSVAAGKLMLGSNFAADQDGNLIISAGGIGPHDLAEDAVGIREISAAVEAMLAGPAFRNGALTGATRQKVQDIINAFILGGWKNSTTVRIGPPKATPYTLSEAQTAAYALSQGPISPRRENWYIPVEVPNSEELPLSRHRLRVGDSATDVSDESDLFYGTSGSTLLGNNQTNTAKLHLFQVSDWPQGDFGNIQVNDLFRTDKNLLYVRDSLIAELLENAQVGQQFYVAEDADGNKTLRVADALNHPLRRYDSFTAGVSTPTASSDSNLTVPFDIPQGIYLDNAGHGDLTLRVDLVLVTSDAHTAFERYANPRHASQLHDYATFSFSSEQLNAMAAWTSASDPGGIEFWTPTVYAAPNTLTGRCRLYVVKRTSRGKLAVFPKWEGSAGVQSIAITPTIYPTWLPSVAAS